MSYIYCTNGQQYKFESRTEYNKFRRGFDHFESVEHMVNYLDANGYFQQAGHKCSFLDFFLSDWDGARIHDLLTPEEFQQLKDYQQKLIAQFREAEKAREWKLVDTYYYADNSVEQIWEDKNGLRKTVMTVGPHGDVC